MKRIFCLSVCIFILYGCAAPLQPQATETQLQSETKIDGITPTGTMDPGTATPTINYDDVETRTITPTPAEIKKIIPGVVSLCQDTNEVPWETMADSLTSSFYILSTQLYDSPPSPVSPLLVTPGNPSPALTNIPSQNSYFKLSPDKQWFLYLDKNFETSLMDIWVVSTDNAQNLIVFSTSTNNSVEWLSDHELILNGSPDAASYERLELYQKMPYQIINPFTGEQRELTYIAGGRTSGRYFDEVFEIDGTPYTLFFNGKSTGIEYLIYDYKNEVSIPAIQWLKGPDHGGMGLSHFPPTWYYGENRFATILAEPEGLDVALFDFEQAQQDIPYNEIMTRIILPEDIPTPLVLGIGPENDLIILQDYDDSRTSEENQFYSLDLTKGEITAYCPFMQGNAGRVSFSPDNRFIAFSMSAPIEIGGEENLVILDLSTGTVSYLPGYLFLGWGN